MRKIILLGILVLVVLVSGCYHKYNLQNEQSMSVYVGHKNFARFELPQNESECNNDSKCFVGGCNGESCTANEPKITTCDVPSGMSRGINCKCINTQCIWTKN